MANPGLFPRHPRGAVIVPDTDPITGFVGTALTWPPAQLRFAVSYVGPFMATAPTLEPHPPAQAACDDSASDHRDLMPASGPCTLHGEYYDAFEVRPYWRDGIAHEVHVRLPHHLLLVTFNRKVGLSYSLREQLTLYRTILATVRDATP